MERFLLDIATAAFEVSSGFLRLVLVLKWRRVHLMRQQFLDDFGSGGSSAGRSGSVSGVWVALTGICEQSSVTLVSMTERTRP